MVSLGTSSTFQDRRNHWKEFDLQGLQTKGNRQMTSISNVKEHPIAEVLSLLCSHEKMRQGEIGPKLKFESESSSKITLLNTFPQN